MQNIIEIKEIIGVDSADLFKVIDVSGKEYSGSDILGDNAKFVIVDENLYSQIFDVIDAKLEENKKQTQLFIQKCQDKIALIPLNKKHLVAAQERTIKSEVDHLERTQENYNYLKERKSSICTDVNSMQSYYRLSSSFCNAEATKNILNGVMRNLNMLCDLHRLHPRDITNQQNNGVVFGNGGVLGGGSENRDPDLGRQSLNSSFVSHSSLSNASVHSFHSNPSVGESKPKTSTVSARMMR
jgi:hypothetical protein